MVKAKVYDLVIIGAGPAGITAAIYAARHQLKFMIISMDIGGQAAMSSDVENYTGYHFISGMDLINKFQHHMQDYKIELKLRERVDLIKKRGKIFEVKTDRKKYLAKAIIIASGKQPKKLNVPGEDNLYNRGVSYCATCDAPLFKDKDVAVVGGSNSAIQAALLLSKYADKVYVLTVNNKLLGEEVLTKKIEQNKKIELITNARTTALIGEERVSGLKFLKDGKETNLNVQGVFVEIGLMTKCDFVPLVKKNKWNEIKIKRSTKSTEENMTNVQGIFAAGDCTDIPAKQIVVAAGEGAKAALAAIDYIEKNYK